MVWGKLTFKRGSFGPATFVQPLGALRTPVERKTGAGQCLFLRTHVPHFAPLAFRYDGRATSWSAGRRPGRHRRHLDRSGLKLAELGPKPVAVDQRRAKVAQVWDNRPVFGPDSAEFGPMSTDSGPKSANFEQSGSGSTRVGPKPKVELTRVGLELTKIGTASTNFGPTSTSTSVDRNWPRLVQIWLGIG